MSPEEYKKYSKKTRADGKRFEKFIEKLFNKFFNWEIHCYQSKQKQYNIGENRAGVEIKYDERSLDTKNVYIEYEEKAKQRKGSYVKSGILRKDNSWLFVIGHQDGLIFCFSIKLLLRLYKRNKKTKKYELKKTPTSKSFLIPIEDAKRMAEWYFKKRCIRPSEKPSRDLTKVWKMINNKQIED